MGTDNVANAQRNEGYRKLIVAKLIVKTITVKCGSVEFDRRLSTLTRPHSSDTPLPREGQWRGNLSLLHRSSL